MANDDDDECNQTTRNPNIIYKDLYATVKWKNLYLEFITNNTHYYLSLPMSFTITNIDYLLYVTNQELLIWMNCWLNEA